MAGQIGEYINNIGVTEWTDLSTLVDWFSGSGSFASGTKYAIYNNSGSSFKFIASSSAPEETRFGTFAPQGSTIYFSPESGSKLYVKGSNFNLAISEV